MNKEELSEKLHVWYLEGTEKLDPENYNPKAQKQYADLNEEQKEIDRYIAGKVLAFISKTLADTIRRHDKVCADRLEKVVAEERERCAKVAEEAYDSTKLEIPLEERIAQAIRNIK